MQNLINQNAILNDEWHLLDSADEASSLVNAIVSGDFALNNAEAVMAAKCGILLTPDAQLEDYKALLSAVPLVAIEFPAFADGRGYSLARLLKERYQFEGEIRAIGDVLIDQLFFMKRCGFDTYALKDGLSAEKALNYFQTFQDPYQMAYDKKDPLFRRKA